MKRQELLTLLQEASLRNPTVSKAVRCILNKYYNTRTYPTSEAILMDNYEELMGILVPTLIAENEALQELAIEQVKLSVSPVIITKENNAEIFNKFKGMMY